MAQNRRKSRIQKQRRHHNPDTTANHTAETVTTTKKAKPKLKHKSIPSPINQQGILNWNSVAIPRIGTIKENPLMTQAVMRDQESAALAWLFITVTFLGIIFSTQWSPLLLSLLVGASLIDKRMREDNRVVMQAALAALLSLACWPLIMQVSSLTNISLSDTAIITLAVFSAALWLVGVTCRRASNIQTRLFTQLGLYSAGIACQALSLIVVFLGAISLAVLVF